MNMDEAIQVSCIIDKLCPSWKDFKHTLKHKKEELSLVELGSHLRIEKSLRALDNIHFNNNMKDMSKDGLILVLTWTLKIYLCDLNAIPSLGNKKYFVTFVDDASRFCYVSLLLTKDEALDKLKVFKTEVKLHQRSLIKRFRIDRGEAIKDEMDSIMGNNTWVLADLPPGCKTLGCKWIFKRKLNVDGTIEKFNRNPKDFGPEFQLYLIEETRDEVSDQHSYCFNVEDDPKTFDEGIKSQDVAFWKEAINNNMDSIMGNNIWVLADLPPGCKPLGCKWIFKRKLKVDGTIEKFKARTKEFLSSKFSIKDMGEADVILGIRIKHESNGITISQSHYIEKVLKKFNYFDCTLVSTLMDTSEKLMPNNGQVVSQLEYSRVIGCLMYVMTCTRHDIAFVVGKLSRYTSNPGTQHWQAIQRALNNTGDNSSTSGWVFLLGGGAISWASKKQTCITGSTIESEFVALTAAGKEAEWLKNFLLEIPLWSKPIAPISIRCDSAATLAKAYSQMYNVKSRHLGVRHSMIRELITNGVISIEFMRSQQNLADHLTKGLARDLIIKSAKGMGLKSN
ncbi:zinc finger, CCHC-type containing protein [Tanacetum coccineum]